MAIHTQTHSAIGADHAVVGGSAYYFLGINTSGTPLEWQVLQAGSLMYLTRAGSAVTLHNNPGDEEVTFAGTGGLWSAMPSAKTELLNWVGGRVQFDLTAMTSCRITACLSVAGSATSSLFAEVSTDGGTTWANLGATVTTSPAVAIDAAAGTVNSSPWVAIRTGYRRDVNLRVVGTGGNASISPIFGHVAVQFR